VSHQSLAWMMPAGTAPQRMIMRSTSRASVTTGCPHSLSGTHYGYKHLPRDAVLVREREAVGQSGELVDKFQICTGWKLLLVRRGPFRLKMEPWTSRSYPACSVFRFFFLYMYSINISRVEIGAERFICRFGVLGPLFRMGSSTLCRWDAFRS
jgi:hypothetical protein